MFKTSYFLVIFLLLLSRFCFAGGGAGSAKETYRKTVALCTGVKSRTLISRVGFVYDDGQSLDFLQGKVTVMNEAPVSFSIRISNQVAVDGNSYRGEWVTADVLVAGNPIVSAHGQAKFIFPLDGNVGSFLFQKYLGGSIVDGVWISKFETLFNYDLGKCETL